MTVLSFTKINSRALLLAGMGMLFACHKKDEFLDQKPNTQLVLPNTLADFQAMLDNDLVMRETPVLGEVSADNFYLLFSFWQGLDIKEQNAYIWAKDIYEGQGQVGDWDYPYQQVFYANVVLKGLPGVAVDSTNRQQWNAMKGAALFIRAYAFYNLAQIFAPLYDYATASTDMGIPLRLDPDVNVASTRASVQQTYTQILSDLVGADTLLPVAIPVNNLNRPSKPAALAMLARVYLSMRNYPLAGAYADSCLQLYSTLIDYNTLDTTSYLPFPVSNAETMYQSRLLSSTSVLAGIEYPGCIVDSGLYRSYAAHDLRRPIFYISSSTAPNLKGSYNGSVFCFSGLATDEVYLIRAEAAARAGDMNDALQDLNALLQKRWSNKVPFPAITASSPQEALDSILVERRKELAFRGLRWTDLRRLNKEGAGIVLTRLLSGQMDTLQSNSQLYVLPIPPDVLSLSGIPQNPGR